MATVNMFVLYSWLLISFVYAANVVLPPTNNDTKSGTPTGLIYLIGADILPTQYVQLCQTIQSKFSQPLYVGIPAFAPSPDASLQEFVELLPDLLKQMESKGLPKNSPIFMAGHSLGGAVLQDFSGTYGDNYTSIYPDWIYKGQMLNAAFITHKWRNNDTQLISENYTTPTLTLGGELDGNLRISRMIEQYYIQLIKNKTDSNQPFVNNKTLLNLPVILINGMSHMEYATGQIPKNVMDHDLIPEINTTQAQDIVSTYMSCWMSLQLNNNKCSFDVIYNGVYQSQTLADPFIFAFILEGSYWFEKPCDCDPLICESTPDCQGGAPWMDDVVYNLNKEWIPQEIMCGFGDKGNVSITVGQENQDSFHPTYQVDPIHYANIWNNCSSPQDVNCILNTTTVTQNIYPPADTADTGGASTTAIEMRHKMKNRQACYEHINAGHVEEDFQICGKINQHSINWALKNAPNQTINRYRKYGEMLEIGQDIFSNTGTDWTYSFLNETRLCNKETNTYYTSVQSNYLYLKTIKMGCKFRPQSECGVHYCKVLSPAHVMEWLYTDGLRFNLSITNENITVNTSCI